MLSKVFSELTHKLKELFSTSFENASIKSAVGGIIIIILTGLIGTRDYLGLSLPLMNNSFTGQVHPFAFVGKLLFTSITLGAGFQGGEVTPLFVIGSTFGNSLSGILHISPSLLAALGLIGIFAGSTNAPITSFVLGIEMFGSQNAEYMFMTCIVSYLFSGHSGIYISQMVSKSKRKLIEVTKEATLSYFRKKQSNNIPVKAQRILLGQFNFGRSSIELPCTEGLNFYKITTKGAGVKLIHHSFNRDGGTWSSNPVDGQPCHTEINTDNSEIHAINVSAAYGKKDKLFLVNTNLFKNIEIDYIAEQQKNRNIKPSSNALLEQKRLQHLEANNEFKEVLLKNQFHLKRSSVELESLKGENIYKIIVTGGKLRLSNHSYNPDGNIWSAPAGNGQSTTIDLEQGSHTLKIFVGEYYGKINKIKLVNMSFKNSAEVKYIVQKVDECSDDEELENLD